MFKVLFPDTLHFHDRNFKSLMNLISEKKIEPVFIKDFDELKKCYGNYQHLKSMFLNEYDELNNLSLMDLFNKKIFGVQIFALCKAELLSFLMLQENWYKDKVPSKSLDIFIKAFNENKEDLLLNMAVTVFWLKFWKNKLKEFKEIYACFIFSGSLIYVKTLNYLLQNTSIKVFVLEHFFTGNDFYIEEKYTHIANNSDIKFRNYYERLKKKYLEEELIKQENEKIKAINKIKMANNKNVKQPSTINDFPFEKSNEKTVLILGQVINDFSIIETDLENINSLYFYKQLIYKLIKETNYNIIFKAHPWERMKININRSLTKEELQDFISNNFDIEEKKRIKIVEDFNIYELFSKCNIIVGLCSQGLIEAAISGKKPYQLGKAFFGEKGFTYDYNSIEAFIKSIKHDFSNEYLSLEEYNNLWLFLTLLLQYHTASVFDSGKNVILNKLKDDINTINIIEKQYEILLEPSINKHIEENLEKTAVVFKSLKEDSFNDINIDSHVKLNKIMEFFVLKFTNEKKYKKFKSNPKKFFCDSKNPFIRLLGKLY